MNATNASPFAAMTANQQGPRLPTIEQLEAIPRYVANRRAAGSGAVWPHKLRDLDPVALATAQAKFNAALVSSKGVALTIEETIAVATARATLLTAIRHGGMLPWVPSSEASVRAARKIGGPKAIPSADQGTIVLDPFGFVPSQLSARDKRIVAGARQSLRDLLSAETTTRNEYRADLIGDEAIAPFRAQLAARFAVPAGVIIGGAIVCVGLAGVWALHDLGVRHVAADLVKTQIAADAGLAALAARLAAGANPNTPSPIEEAAAKALPDESWRKWIGPAIALGVVSVATITAIKVAT